MAEKIPKSCSEDFEIEEKPDNDIAAVLFGLSDDKTEGFEETGYGSLPGSSDVMSGAESSIWTSDDHPPYESISQETMSEVTSFGSDVGKKSGGAVKKTTSRKPKLGLFKKASPVGKVVKSADLTENLIPSEDDGTRTSPRKTRSRSKFASGLPKLVSLRKTRSADKPQSYSPVNKQKDSKTSPKKSPVKKTSTGIPKSVTPKEQLKVSSADDNKARGSPEKGKRAKSQRLTKSASLPSKPKISMQVTSVEGEDSEVQTLAAESEKTGECSVKPKRAPKLSLGKLKTTKQEPKAGKPLVKRSSLTDVKTEISSATSSAYAMVRRGIKKMDVTGKLKKSAKKTEETHLIEDDNEPVKAKAKQGKDEPVKAKAKQRKDEPGKDKILNEPPRVYKETTWKPSNPAQEGGLLDEDLVVCDLSSEIDTTPTEMSTLSDSSSLKKGKSKSQRSRLRTLDSLSKMSSFEEEVEGTVGFKGDMRPQLQRQTNVPDPETEEDSESVFDSPKHVAMPKKESEGETKE